MECMARRKSSVKVHKIIRGFLQSLSTMLQCIVATVYTMHCRTQPRLSASFLETQSRWKAVLVHSVHTIEPFVCILIEVPDR